MSEIRAQARLAPAVVDPGGYVESVRELRIQLPQWVEAERPPQCGLCADCTATGDVGGPCGSTHPDCRYCQQKREFGEIVAV